MSVHPVYLRNGVNDEMVKEGIAPMAILGALATVAGAAWGINELRKAWYGPPASHTLQVKPTIMIPENVQKEIEEAKRRLQSPQQANFFSSLPGGYAIPGAAVGALIGGLAGQNPMAALLGGLAGGGLGLGINYLSRANSALQTPQNLVQPVG